MSYVRCDYSNIVLFVWMLLHSPDLQVSKNVLCVVKNLRTHYQVIYKAPKVSLRVIGKRKKIPCLFVWASLYSPDHQVSEKS